MLYDHVVEATNAILAHVACKPSVAIVLGTGLGDLVHELDDVVAIPYTEIPHFVQSTVVGHAGRLLIGNLEGVPVIVMQGRFHLYEGYTPQVLTFPIRVMALLGAHTLIVTNAAGGVNPAYHPGTFMLIRDHISLPALAGANPLVGANDERLGPRFPALAKAYDVHLRSLARTVAAQQAEITLHEGTYTMVAGPSFETDAELRFLRVIGTDAVGMSTVPEVIVARHMGMRVLGLSLITNAATGEETDTTSESSTISHVDVLAVADTVRPQFVALVRGIIRVIPAS